VIGEALYVFFGAPESTTDRHHAVRWVNMAIDMQRKRENQGQGRASTGKGVWRWDKSLISEI